MVYQIEERINELKEEFKKDYTPEMLDKIYIRIMVDDDDDSYTTKKFGQIKEVEVPYEEAGDGSATSSQDQLMRSLTGIVINQPIYVTLKDSKMKTDDDANSGELEEMLDNAEVESDV